MFKKTYRNRLVKAVAPLALALLGSCAQSSSATDGSAPGAASDGEEPPLVFSTFDDTLDLYGPVGGPFPQGTRTYQLRNQGSELAVWRLDASEPWMLSNPTAGVLAPGQAEAVTFEIDHALANSLPEGTYPSQVVLRTVANGNGEIYIDFVLHVLPAGGSALRVNPITELVINTDVNAGAGDVDGSIEVENTGSVGFIWHATASDPWLNLVFPPENRFNPGEIDTLDVQVDEAMLSTLGIGTHQSSIHFYDTADPAVSLDLPIVVHLSQTANNRVTQGLQGEYRFNEGSGNVIHDTSAAGMGGDLVIQDPSAVTWQASGLHINSPTLIASPGAATGLVQAVRQEGQVTVEAWIRPDNVIQDGPARIVGISNGPNMRNFSLAQGLWGGQPSDTYNMRLRTSATDLDGMPLLTTAPGAANTAMQHLVYTLSQDGTERLYRNGVIVAQQFKGGDLSNWDSSYRLAIANEIGAQRAWLGEIFLVAVYNRALTDPEIQQNFGAGSGATNEGHLDVTPGTQLYVNAIRGVGPVSDLPDFQLANVGGEALDWSAFENASWLSFGSSAGALQPGQSTTVMGQLDDAAIAALPAGQYHGDLIFRNQTNQSGTNLSSVTLTVSEPGAPGNGNRPGPSNTGPTNPNNLQVIGGQTITQDGTVLENFRMFGSINIEANNVTIRNFIIDAGNQPYAIRCNNGTSGLLIEDGELMNVYSAHIYGSGFTALRLNMHDSGGDGFKTLSNVHVEGCWVHHLGTNPGAHADCCQIRQGGNQVFRNNFFELPIDIGAPYKQNAAWIIQTGEGPIDNILVENNWINGGNYSIFVENKHTTNPSLPNYGDPTNVRIINNRFMRDFRFGPLRATSYALTSGNRWDDTDQLMDINNQ